MATLMRNCEAGHTPRKSPDSAAPIAGVYRDVKPRLMRGLRRRKGRAEGSSNEARRRMKKRYSRRWKSRIRESEADSRTCDALGLVFFWLGLLSLVSTMYKVLLRCVLLGWPYSSRDDIPCLEGGICRSENTQTGSYCRDTGIVFAFYYGFIFAWW